MGKRIKIKSGEKYGRLTIEREVDAIKGSIRKFLCKCRCGKKKIIRLADIRSGHTQSCGCLNSELLVKRNWKHGYVGTRLYVIWEKMLNRCRNSKNKDYKYYGGRGISICKEWTKHEVFQKWAIASGYNDTLTIERINNDKNYEPSNCKWIPHGQQSINRRSNISSIINGIKFPTLTMAARHFGVPYVTAQSRLKRGLDIKQALGL